MDRVTFRADTILGLGKKVEDACKTLGVPPSDAAVTLSVGYLTVNRAVVSSDLWLQREALGRHQDEADPITIIF